MGNRPLPSAGRHRGLIASGGLLLLWLVIAAGFAGYGYYLAPRGFDLQTALGHRESLEGLVGLLGLGVGVATSLTAGIGTFGAVIAGRATRFGALLYLLISSVVSV